MKTKLLSVFCCLYFSIAAFAQCPTGDVTFNTQASIDQFAIDYPTCTQINGNLTIIYGMDITNLNALSNITNITGYLWIYYNPYITNLQGLNNLTSVGSYLFIDENDSLTSISGLNALVSTGGFLQIVNNDNLLNVNGLNSLTNVTQLNVINNFSLTNLNGLTNLQSVGNSNIYITNNPVLTDISGLSNINSLTISGGNGLFIDNNAQLSLCELPNFCTYLSYDPSTHPRTITNNLGTCLNEQAVLTICGFLGLENISAKDDVQMYQQNNQIIINSEKYNITSVEIFDTTGKYIYQNNTLNETNVNILLNSISAQILILKVQIEGGKIVTKRIINTQ